MARSSLKNIAELIKAQQNNQPVEQKFLRELKKSIELSDEKNSRLPSKTYKPSSLNCPRNMYYQVIGAEPTDTSSNYCLVGICESGTDRHERIQNAVADMCNNDFDCEYVDVEKYIKSRNLKDVEVISKQGNETKLYHKTLNISFLCDGIIRYQGRYYIIEFKTESVYKWNARLAVAPEHKNQAFCYSMALGIDEVIFVYINRDNCDMKSYLLTVTDKDKQSILEKIEYCDQYVKILTPPPVPSSSPELSKACKYCNYATRCRKDG